MVLDEVQSLEECCLSTIVANFDLFMMDYRSSEPRFSKPYEFLQRTYSDMLMAKLIEKCKLQDEHLYFLINPYIKKLHFEKSTVNPQIVIERLKVVGSAITSLNLSSIRWRNDEVKELFPLLPMLRELSVCNGRCCDEVLEYVARNCPHLEVLDVTDCGNVTAKALKCFCTDENGCLIDNMTLKELKMFTTDVARGDLYFILEHFPSLTVLEHEAVCDTICSHHMTAFLGNAIDSLPKYNLTVLMLSFDRIYPISDVLNLCATVCPNINILKITHMSHEDDVKACMKFKKLTDLQIFDIPSSANLSLTPFIESRGYNLQRYEQNSGRVSAIKLCECCPKLEQLILRDVEFEASTHPNESSNMHPLPNLVDLCVENAAFIQPVVAESVNLLIRSSPKLETISLHYAEGLTDSIINSITACHCVMTTLRRFDVSYSNFEARFARKILECAPRLEALIITHTNILPDEYNELNDLRRVNVNHIVNIIWGSWSSDTSDYDIDDFYDNIIDYDFENDDYEDYFDGYDDYEDYDYVEPDF